MIACSGPFFLALRQLHRLSRGDPQTACGGFQIHVKVVQLVFEHLGDRPKVARVRGGCLMVGDGVEGKPDDRRERNAAVQARRDFRAL